MKLTATALLATSIASPQDHRLVGLQRLAHKLAHGHTQHSYPYHNHQHYNSHYNQHSHHHQRYFHGDAPDGVVPIDAKVHTKAEETERLVLDDGETTEIQEAVTEVTGEVVFTEIVSLAEDEITLPEGNTISVELDATDNVEDLPAKIAGAINDQVGGLVDPEQVDAAAQQIRGQLANVTALLQLKAEEAAAKAQSLSKKAQAAAEKAAARAKTAAGDGAERAKAAAAEAQAVAVKSAAKAKAVAAEAVQQAKNATDDNVLSTVKDKLAEGAEKSQSAVASVAESVKTQAKAAAKSAADTLNKFAEPEKRKLSEDVRDRTIAAGSVGLGVLCLTGLGIAVRRKTFQEAPTDMTETDGSPADIDNLRDLAEGTFDMY